jgi:hypothetical protein
MAEPVRRDFAGKPRTAGGGAHNAPELSAGRGATRFADGNTGLSSPAAPHSVIGSATRTPKDAEIGSYVLNAEV